MGYAKDGLRFGQIGMVQILTMAEVMKEPERAFQASLNRRVSKRLNRDLLQSQMAAALSRLETHGFLTSEKEDAGNSIFTNTQPRRFYSITDEGKQLLNMVQTLFDEMKGNK